MDKLSIVLTYQGGKFYKAHLNGKRIDKEDLEDIIGTELPWGNIRNECESWINTQNEYEVDYFDEFDVS